MRILFALNTFRPYIDGVGVTVERQAIGLASRGHEVGIIAPSPTSRSYVETTTTYRVYRCRSVPFGAPYRRVAWLPGAGVERALGDFRPDLAVVSLPFLLSRAVWGRARVHSVPLVGITSMMPEWVYYNFATVRSIAPLIDGYLWRWITDYYGQCDHVVGVSETALRLLTKRGLCTPASVISNGVQLDRFCPRPRDRQLAERLKLPNKLTILYAGRLDPEKCMDVWVRAIPRVLEQVDAHFVIGGEGTDRPALERQVSALGLSSSVTFVGFQRDDDYPSLFSLADVFAITSPSELQSVVTLEAAASGLPIIAVHAGALPELVRDGENGYLVPVGDSGGLALALTRVLLDPSRRYAMGVASRRIASPHDFRRSLDDYERLYREVAQRSPARRPRSYLGRSPRAAVS
jgi:glycosyltransferase involved in cell wall biosynthesis